MAAITLQLRSKCRVIRNPKLVQLFSSSSSSSSSPESNNGEDKKESQSPPSISSYFSDVKASLRQSSPPPRRIPPSSSESHPSFSIPKPSNVASLEEIRKNLSEFRHRSSPPSPGEKSSSSYSKAVSFQELYKRHVIEKRDEANNTVESNKSGRLSFDAISDSLRQLRPSSNQTPRDRFRAPDDRMRSNVLDPYSLKEFKDSLKIQSETSASGPSMVFGGSENLPPSVFGRELESKTEVESRPMKTEFVKMYSPSELGEKLRKLRPTYTKGDKYRFSLEELNERLKKLREIEVKELDSRIGGVSFKDLRESLVKLRISNDDKTKNSTMRRLDILGHLSGTPTLMLAPPKEHLVEKYFHPDNMSSEEKLKLELKKIRDEFKMSESDCGSSRVQVAQLTVKIKHLSSVLHKKDKHSRKGLVAMVQRRKKILKYLRRTDWDSYCFVLDKLGLRDNPDYKH